jgi:membrane protein implicated in regulation of membrane protease activity
LETLTVIAIIGGLAMVILDMFVPSAGLLSGAGIAIIIERGLDALGVASSVRWPLAGLAMLATIGLVIRYGERFSERLFPAKIKTNIDRLIGLQARVHRLEGPVIELEGDLWTAKLDGPFRLEVGDVVDVVDFVDQVPIVRPAA